MAGRRSARSRSESLRICFIVVMVLFLPHAKALRREDGLVDDLAA